jgi:hypothetical protein
MDNSTNYIVYLCYGKARVFDECVFSLLSLSRMYPKGLPANTQIWIYTDNAEWFRSFADCPLPLHYREIDDATIKEWRGKINFVHRVKIEALADLMNSKEGNVLYLDTDTLFIQPIDNILRNINEDQRYMHIDEGVVSSSPTLVLQKLNAHLKKSAHTRPLMNMPMWNAGVLGFNTGRKGLLRDVLEFTDREYPLFPKHVVEQFAFSVYLGNEGKLKEAAPYIFHYWNLKEMEQVLSSFFAYFKSKNWQELVRYSAWVDVTGLLEEKNKFYRGRNIIGKLLGKHWAVVIPDWSAAKKQPNM